MLDISIDVDIKDIITLVKNISLSLKEIHENNTIMMQNLKVLRESFFDEGFDEICMMVKNCQRNLEKTVPELEIICQQLIWYSELLMRSKDFIQSQSFDNSKECVGSNINELNKVMVKYSSINGEHSIEDDLMNTNPNYSKTDTSSPWNNNCQRCVSAYEARRRGFDVEAQPFPAGLDTLSIMRHPEGWPNVYDGAKLIDCSANSGTGAAINIENEMDTWDDNARAIVRVKWKRCYGGGGHVFIAEKNNGQIRFIDPQNGEYDARSYFDFAKGSDVFCMRIDNLPFTDKIHQCCFERTIEMG